GVACNAARAVDQLIALDDADAGAREVELVASVYAGKLRRLSADERTACRAADLRCSLDELGDLLGVDPRCGDVVEQEERLRAGAEHVVDAVRREIHSRPAQPSGPTGQHQLRADAVRRRGEQLPVIQRKEPGESAELARAR